MTSIRVAIDIGGTFTDVVVAVDEKIVRADKVLTTYSDLLDAVTAAADMGLESLTDHQHATLVHGTTLVSNALIEKKGADVGLLVTKGFRDTILIGDESRFDMYDLELVPPKPIIGAEQIHEVAERTDASGDVLEPVAAGSVQEHSAGLPASVAVALLHSNQNAENEQRVREILTAERPDIDVSLSSDVAQEVGEYARMNTAVANAYVKPLVRPYLSRLREFALTAFDSHCEVLMMLSSGGLAPVATVAELPIRIVESGPAAGVTAAHAFLSENPGLFGDAPIISLDMGGTTAKVAFLRPNERLRLRTSIEVARTSRLHRGSGMPLMVPSVDLIEIGAGGGSIAQTNEVGLLEVGPHSASSEPGPACYGRGGVQPTVTDANVVLGYVPSWQRLGGSQPIRADLAEDALGDISETLETSAAQTASAIHQIANEHMASAIRVSAAERGLLPERHTIVAFGGAAPLHVCGVARRVGISRVVVPPAAGVFSAVGLCVAAPAYEAVRTARSVLPLTDESLELVAGLYEAMEHELAETLQDELTFEALADVRFVGQHQSITVSIGAPSKQNIAENLLPRFEQEYRALFERLPKAAAEVSTWRLRGHGPSPNVQFSHQEAGASNALTESVSGALFPDRDGTLKRHDARVLRRTTEESGVGPALIVESHTTVVIPPGWKWRIDHSGAVVLDDLGFGEEV